MMYIGNYDTSSGNASAVCRITARFQAAMNEREALPTSDMTAVSGALRVKVRRVSDRLAGRNFELNSPDRSQAGANGIGEIPDCYAGHRYLHSSMTAYKSLIAYLKQRSRMRFSPQPGRSTTRVVRRPGSMSGRVRLQIGIGQGSEESDDVVDLGIGEGGGIARFPAEGRILVEIVPIGLRQVIISTDRAV